jgi:hypothetical protein
MASPKKKWLRMKALENAASKAQAAKVAEAQRTEATAAVKAAERTRRAAEIKAVEEAAVKASVEKVTQTRRPRRSKNIEN